MAGVIKGGVWRSGKVAPQAAEFNFEDINRRADDYLETVRQRADAIIAEARAKADELERQAADKARIAAEAEAQRQLKVRLDEMLNTLTPAVKNAVAEIGNARQALINQWQQETVRLAIAIAERLVRRELGERPEISSEWILESLRLAVGGGQFRLHLHPLDIAEQGPWVDKLTAELSELTPTETVADSTVSRGGCRVVTEFGEIDQTLEAQLARIEEELIGTTRERTLPTAARPDVEDPSVTEQPSDTQRSG